MTRIIKANAVNVTAIFKWHTQNRQLKSAATLTGLKLMLDMGSVVPISNRYIARHILIKMDNTICLTKIIQDNDLAHTRTIKIG